MTSKPVNAPERKGRRGFATLPGSLTLCLRPWLPPPDSFRYRITVGNHRKNEDQEGEHGSEHEGERMIVSSVHLPVHPQLMEGAGMPLIQKEKKEVFKTIPIRLEESLAEQMLAYAEFLDSSKDHIVSEAMRYIIDRDKEFAAHLLSNGGASQMAKRPRSKRLIKDSAKAGQ